MANQEDTAKREDKKDKKQITMYVKADILKEADEAARETYDRNNARTSWIIDAIKEKLERREEAIEGEGKRNSEETAKLRAIVSAYESMNDEGKAWLIAAAKAARNFEDFTH